MTRICLVDIFETVSPHGEHEMAITGRLESGETACVFVRGLEHYVYVAVGRAFVGRALQDQLNAALIKPVGRAMCTRTLCECRRCRKCQRSVCGCRCTECQKSPCACPCRKCGHAKKKCTCRSIAQVEINSEPCAKLRRTDRQPVLGVERVARRGLIGFERDTRPFLKIQLRYPQWTGPARDFLENLDTLTEKPYEKGTYGSCRSAVDAWIWQKNATGFCWLEFEGAAPLNRRTRCHAEFVARNDRVRVVQTDLMPPPLTRMTLDCEMLAEGRWGDNDPICMISVRMGARKIVHVATLELIETKDNGWEILQYADERAMLEAVLERVRAEDPDVLCGYNAAKFDVPRILKRCETLGVAADFSRLVGEPVRFLEVQLENKGAGGMLDTTLVDLKGRILYDPLVPLRRTTKLRSYRLEAVAEEYELSILKGDVEYREIWSLWHGDAAARARLVEYCANDSDVCHELVEKQGMMEELVASCEVKRLPARQVLTRQQTFCYQRAMRAEMGDEFLAPDLPRGPDGQAIAPWFTTMPELAAMYAAGDFIGGYVQDPVRGLHELALTLDFASLYPSIMRRHNLCNATFCGDSLKEVERRGLLPEEVTRTENGFYFAKTEVREGVLSRILKKLLDARARARALMAEATDPRTKKLLDARQNQYKISANSVYGVQGAATNPTGNKAIASAVTTYGRKYINQVKDYLNEKYAHIGEVIYGDTDSLMFRFNFLIGHDLRAFKIPNARVMEFIEAARVLFAQMSDDVNKTSGIFQPPMKMTPEKLLLRFLLEAKKRYAAVKYEPTPGSTSAKLIMQGIETARRDNPLFVAQELERFLELMLVDGAPKAQLFEFIRNLVSDVINNRIEFKRLIASENISKPLDEYKTKAANVNVARQLLAAGLPFALGDRVDMVYIAGHRLSKTESAYSAKLFDPKTQALDLGHYVDEVRRPFTRAIEGMFTPEELTALWNVQGYGERLVVSRTSGAGALARHFAIKGDVYTKVKRRAQPYEELVAPKKQRTLDSFF